MNIIRDSLPSTHKLTTFWTSSSAIENELYSCQRIELLKKYYFTSVTQRWSICITYRQYRTCSYDLMIKIGRWGQTFQPLKHLARPHETVLLHWLPRDLLYLRHRFYSIFDVSSFWNLHEKAYEMMPLSTDQMHPHLYWSLYVHYNLKESSCCGYEPHCRSKTYIH